MGEPPAPAKERTDNTIACILAPSLPPSAGRQVELDQAMPAFFAAVEALNSLNKRDIDEVKSFATPPEKVKLTLDAVLLLLKEKPGWDTAKKACRHSRSFVSMIFGACRNCLAHSFCPRAGLSGAGRTPPPPSSEGGCVIGRSPPAG